MLRNVLTDSLERLSQMLGPIRVKPLHVLISAASESADTFKELPALSHAGQGRRETGAGMQAV